MLPTNGALDDGVELLVTGELFAGGQWVPGAVGVSDGRIVFVGDPGAAPPARRYLERPCCWLLPGAVDPHVHALSTSAEGITRATAGAAAGGVTTIVDMPYDGDEPINSLARFQAKARAVQREALVDMALFATITPEGPDPQADVQALAEAGACAYKVSLFEAHPVRMPRLADDRLYDVFGEVARTGLPIAVHAENHFIVDTLTRRRRAEGPGDLLAHLAVRPAVAEAEGIARALELAYWTGVRLHIVHISIPRGIDLLVRARADGQPATGETCLHYLLLTAEEAQQLGSFAKINPPLRTHADREGLWQALAEGKLDAVTSDHVPSTAAEKAAGDFFDAPTGVPGVQLLLPLFLDMARRRDLDLARAIYLLAEGPARCYGLYPRKGRLGPGADGDLVAYDPDAVGSVHPATQHSIAGWTPYAGRRYHGEVVTTIVGGQVVYDRGAIVASPGSGRFIRP